MKIDEFDHATDLPFEEIFILFPFSSASITPLERGIFLPPFILGFL
jgi:hypothetical protein